MKLPYYEIAALIIGEVIVSSITGIIYLIIGKFDISVLLGSVLGSGVVVVNFIALSIVTNRVLDSIMADRGTAEMDDEQAAEFAAKHQHRLQNTVKLSYIVRTLVMLVTLVLAFLLQSVFNVKATLVPLLMFRPIITVSQLIARRKK